MRRKTKGQSLVEMALILPMMLLLLFAIIDMGYYLYGYSTIYQAARNGADTASGLPPGVSKVAPARATPDTSDPCVAAIMTRIQADASLFPDLTSGGSTISINYPGTRALGQTIEVRIIYNIQPLTPLWRLVSFGNNGTMRVESTARRSIESLGNNPTVMNLTFCNPE